MRRVGRLAAGVAAAVFVLGASALLLDPGSALGGGGSAPGAQAPRGSVSAGRQLFIESCTSCHGWNAEGIAGVAPSLHGVGASAADFMLTTGRMPLSTIGQQPHRTRAKYSPAQIADLDAYIGSFGGPGVPSVDTSSASISEGQELFADNCSGCHQIVERGGMVTGASVPSLTSASARQVAEAVRLGPFLMPRFNGKLLSDRQVASIARFVVTMRDPPSPGGAGIGYIGPVPEGMVTWLFALPLILLATRLIGQRTEH